MLNGGHLDLNSVQFCSDSLKEKLKQMMIDQELVFVGQVFELHRLYRVQIAMTEDIKQKGLDNYGIQIADSSPVNLNNQDKCSMSDLQSSTLGFKQKPLDLQLSADEFIRQSAHDLSGKEALGGLFPIESKNSFQYAVAFDLNRSLTIGEDTGNRVAEHRSWMGKRTSGPTPDIIDLENPYLSFSNNDADLGLPFDLATPSSFLKDKHELERFINKNNLQSSSKSRTRHVHHGSTSSRPFNDVGLTSQKQTLCKTGLNGDFVVADTSVPRGRVKLDLNTLQLEDMSFISRSHSGVANPEATAFSTMTEKVYSQSTVVSSVSPTSWRQSNVSSCAEILDAAQNSIDTAGGKLSRGGMPKDDEGKIVFIDLDSDSGEELCNSGDPKLESVGSTLKLSNGLSCEIEIGKVPIPFSSYDESQVVDIGPERAHSGVLEQRSSESPDSNICCINIKAEMDGTEQTAAELLVQISLAKLNFKDSESKEDDRPQCSSESYEAMVLNTKDCSPDDYCVSSNAMVVDESEKKDSRYKLKRGTRMKDFQKDILSSLSTLSRHEIREDMHIFEGVIKSQEYQKMRAKTAGGGNWCRPTRSKRSRISRR